MEPALLLTSVIIPSLSKPEVSPIVFYIDRSSSAEIILGVLKAVKGIHSTIKKVDDIFKECENAHGLSKLKCAIKKI